MVSAWQWRHDRPSCGDQHDEPRSGLELVETEHGWPLRILVLVNRALHAIAHSEPARVVELALHRNVDRFLDAFVSPNRVELRTDLGNPIGTLTDAPDKRWVEPSMPRLVEDLVLVQSAAGLTRKVPPGAAADEFRAVAVAADLLRGKVVEITWGRVSATVEMDASADERAALIGHEVPFRYVSPGPRTVMFVGVEYSLRRQVQVNYVGRVEDPKAEWIAAGEIPPGADIVLVPGSNRTGKMTLVP
jgi:hypothetical protein